MLSSHRPRLGTAVVLLAVVAACFPAAQAARKPAAAVRAAAASTPDYSTAGPCSSSVVTLDVTLPKAEYSCTCQCAVQLSVQLPGGEGCAAAGYASPFPLVLFVSGFQATSANYREYAVRLASWGFAVLQYDFKVLSPYIDALCHSDAAEAGFMLFFLQELRKAAATPASPLYRRLDFASLAAAGHSRGGKIAALHLAGTTPNIRAAYLVDAIDGSVFTEPLMGYPSAVELLRGRNKKFGMTAAARIGLCNGAPFATGNWSKFDEVAAPGSWLEVVSNAGHLQFVDISSNWDALCCTGCKGLISQQDGMELALVPMVAWFMQELRGAAGPPQRLRAATQGFMAWVCAQEKAGAIQFVVKGTGEMCPRGVPRIARRPELRVEVVQAQQVAAMAEAAAAFATATEATAEIALAAAAKAAAGAAAAGRARAAAAARAAASAGVQTAALPAAGPEGSSSSSASETAAAAGDAAAPSSSAQPARGAGADADAAAPPLAARAPDADGDAPPAAARGEAAAEAQLAQLPTGFSATAAAEAIAAKAA